MLAIETQALSRHYASTKRAQPVVALDAVNIQVEVGEVRGLLGPNGAGKTTLVKILSTVLLPSQGSAQILGYDVAQQTTRVRPLIGLVLGGDRGLYTNLSARQNLEYWAALYNVPASRSRQRVAALLERVGLGARADHLVSTFSRGMKQRLHLARGLIADARVLFLDEPTIGMDPLAARDFRQIVHELRAEGCTILLTTHDMAEAEALCDRVALIDHGRLLAVEKPARLAEYVAQFDRIDFEGVAEGIIERLNQHQGVLAVKKSAQGHRIELADNTAQRSVLSLLLEMGITNIRTSRPSLEEVYVHMIGDRGLKI